MFNPLLNVGMEAFCQSAAEAGAAGLTVLIYPLRKRSGCRQSQSVTADLVLLVATPQDRMGRIATCSRGFTYLVSVTGVTGERAQMESRVEGLVQQLKQTSPVPVAVGFGISGAEQVRQVRGWGADGAIVGSALVKQMAAASLGPQLRKLVVFALSCVPLPISPRGCHPAQAMKNPGISRGYLLFNLNHLVIFVGGTHRC